MSVTSTVRIVINSAAGTFGSNSSSSVDRAVTILHELRHAFNMISGLGGAPRIVSDGAPGQVSLSEKNSKVIRDACF
jgi:hypothetical protein